MARHRHDGDVDGDGDRDSADHNYILNAVSANNNNPVPIGQSGYHAEADIDRDGDVDGADYGLAQGTETALTPGVLSDSYVNNIFGWCGYVFDSETGFYLARNRYYYPARGRWIQRDPAGYMDSNNLYAYGISNPIGWVDPFGLQVVYASDPYHNSDPTAYGSSGNGLPNLLTAAAVFSNGPEYILRDRDEVLAEMAQGGGWVDWLHTILDIAGMIPVAGGFFDAANALLYLSEGDYGNAALSTAAIAFEGATLVRVITRHGKKLHVYKTCDEVAGSIGAACFVAGTMVATASGLIAIEALQSGDMVWSFEIGSQRWELCEVEATSQHEYDGDVVTLEVSVVDAAETSSETILCTGNHPFWVSSGIALDERPSVEELPSDEALMQFGGGRWTEARWLRLGDHFVTRTGKSATVVGLTIRMERVPVYNLTVKRLHNYAVGECGVLVHNACRIINKRLAGQNHPVTGVPFDANGFPIFNQWSIKNVKVKQTGNRYLDEAAANEAAGFTNTPAGYVWHHSQDGQTMQLIPKKIHEKTGHTGGVGILKDQKLD